MEKNIAIHGRPFLLPGRGRSGPLPCQPIEKMVLKNGFVGNFGCHWVCQCRAVVWFSTLAKPVARFFNGLLRSRPGKMRVNGYRFFLDSGFPCREWVQGTGPQKSLLQQTPSY